MDTTLAQILSYIYQKEQETKALQDRIALLEGQLRQLAQRKEVADALTSPEPKPKEQ